MDANFKTVSWAATSTIYEVNIRQYTSEGTFVAFQKHLPRLQSMGVDILWLMPITPISQFKRKGSLGSYYACSSYTKINPEMGNENDFSNLVKAAHSLGMKVMMDWVANHTGAKHEWMDLHPDWFSRDDLGNFTERNGWDDVVDLNYQNEAMRKALIASMQYWVRDFKIDGFRCDMAHLVPLDFWREARTACETIQPLFWLAECDVPEYHLVFDASYAWNWMHISEKLARGESQVHDIYQVLHDYEQYPHGALKLWYTSNHDENSWNGTEYEKYQLAAKPWSVFSFTWKGMPLIYSGQELPNHKRLAFFEKDALHWDQIPALQDFYTTLTHFRKKSKALTQGGTFILPTSTNGVLAYLRFEMEETILVVLNVSNDHHKINLSHELLEGTFTNLFSHFSYPFHREVSFELMPGDFFVYYKS
jgi:glycosidase